MLLLTDQREVHADKPLIFEVLGAQIIFKYNIKSRGYYRQSAESSLQLEVKCDMDDREFIMPYPAPYQDIVKQLGGWIGHLLRRKEEVFINIESMKNKTYRRGENIWLSDDKAIKKLKSKTYLASNRVARILTSWAQQDFLIGSGIAQKDWAKVLKINYRIGVGRKNGLMQFLPVFHDIHKYGKQGTFEQVVSDLSVYNRSLSKYILLRYNPTTDYQEFLKTLPYYAKNCKYGFTLSNEESPYLDDCHKAYGKPSARFNWFVLYALIHQKKAIIDDNKYLVERLSDKSDVNWAKERFDENNLRLEFLEKLYRADRSVWTYFRKHMRIQKHYSTGLIVSMLDTIKDGRMIYENSKTNTHSIKFMPVEGSAMNMVRNALYNHNQDRELSKKRQFDKPNFHLPTPPIKLPDWIESIRLKTAHEMIAAGIDCNHCIGNYTQSTDIFVREKDICAQIHRRDLTVGQCYDVRDAITKASKDLRTRLMRALDKIRPKEIKDDKARALVGAEAIPW
jgi:hypothetical protein